MNKQAIQCQNTVSVERMTVTGDGGDDVDMQ